MIYYNVAALCILKSQLSHIVESKVDDFCLKMKRKMCFNSCIAIKHSIFDLFGFFFGFVRYEVEASYSCFEICKTDLTLISSSAILWAHTV